MNLLNQNPRLLVVTLTVSFFLSLGANPQAQKKSQMPSRTGHVNDFAGVVDENTKQRLENILQNLKLKSGIQLDLATVESTGGRDIFDFSRQLAREWHVGDRNSSKRSLLLVLSVNDKAIFTQFSKSVQTELPEGILGDMSQRMRALAASEKFAESLSAGVDYFVGTLARKIGFS